MNLASILEAIFKMSGPELERVREAVERRRERLSKTDDPEGALAEKLGR